MLMTYQHLSIGALIKAKVFSLFHFLRFWNSAKETIYFFDKQMLLLHFFAKMEFKKDDDNDDAEMV